MIGIRTPKFPALFDAFSTPLISGLVGLLLPANLSAVLFPSRPSCTKSSNNRTRRASSLVPTSLLVRARISTSWSSCVTNTLYFSFKSLRRMNDVVPPKPRRIRTTKYVTRSHHMVSSRYLWLVQNGFRFPLTQTPCFQSLNRVCEMNLNVSYRSILMSNNRKITTQRLWWSKPMTINDPGIRVVAPDQWLFTLHPSIKKIILNRMD